jgi:hypothetical protein
MLRSSVPALYSGGAGSDLGTESDYLESGFSQFFLNPALEMAG